MNVGSGGSAGIAGTSINEQYRRNKLMVVRGFQHLFSDKKLLDTTHTQRNCKNAPFI